MTAVPANISYNFVIQDNRGFKSNVRFDGFESDVSTDAGLISAVYTRTAGIITALAALTNAKVVKAGFAWSFDYAQEPTSESGTYELVIQKARLNGGDGTGAFEHVSIPAPQDSLFLTDADNNLLVVNPAATSLTGLQTALSGVHTRGGGTAFSQFFGGQYLGSKPRRRRVLQGA